MADLIADDTLVAFFAHPGNSASPGRQLLDRVFASDVGGELSPLDKVFKQVQKQKHGCDDFYHPTSGTPETSIAAVFLGLLRDPHIRKDFVQLTRVSPEGFRSDEDCARWLAVGWMIANLAKLRDAEVNWRFGQVRHEIRKAQTLHELGEELGEDYDEVAKRHVRKAVEHLKAAWSAREIVRYAGSFLERNFSLRAPRLAAKLVTRALGLKSKMKERQARYLCGWERHRANQTA
jgi:hypothetical protein